MSEVGGGVVTTPPMLTLFNTLFAKFFIMGGINGVQGAYFDIFRLCDQTRSPEGALKVLCEEAFPAAC